jgi:uncharacterized membrane protein YciS (DUF1049 family)
LELAWRVCCIVVIVVVVAVVVVAAAAVSSNDWLVTDSFTTKFSRYYATRIKYQLLFTRGQTN